MKVNILFFIIILFLVNEKGFSLSFLKKDTAKNHGINYGVSFGIGTPYCKVTNYLYEFYPSTTLLKTNNISRIGALIFEINRIRLQTELGVSFTHNSYHIISHSNGVNPYPSAGGNSFNNYYEYQDCLGYSLSLKQNILNYKTIKFYFGIGYCYMFTTWISTSLSKIIANINIPLDKRKKISLFTTFENCYYYNKLKSTTNSEYNVKKINFSLGFQYKFF